MPPSPPPEKLKKLDVLMRSSSSRNSPSIIKFLSLPRCYFFFPFFAIDFSERLPLFFFFSVKFDLVVFGWLDFMHVIESFLMSDYYEKGNEPVNK